MYEGMVLIRSDSGQLMLVSQQALAQAQGMLPKPTNASVIVRPSSTQVCVCVCYFDHCLMSGSEMH